MQQHVFQPVPLDLFEINPFTKIDQEWMAISAGTEEKANTMTASWGGMGTLWGKSVVFCFVRESRYTKEFLDKTEGFSCTFFEKGNRTMLKYFGSVSGRDEDKLKNARMHFDFVEGIPYINEGDMVLIMKKLASFPMEPSQIVIPDIVTECYPKGDPHTMYVGEVIRLMAR